MNTKRVPPNGYGCADGTILNAAQVSSAVRRYARKHNFSASVIRAMTSLKQAAIRDYLTRKDKT